jgi:integrase/recombinase XerC
MSKPNTKPPPLPEAFVADWWAPFAAHLSGERRYSAYTVRNYRQAFDDFHRWRINAGIAERPLDSLEVRAVRDFVIEAQRRYGCSPGRSVCWKAVRSPLSSPGGTGS